MLHTKSILELLRDLKSKQYSFEEVANYFKERISKHENLNAFISTTDENNIKKQVRHTIQGKPLSGIPGAIKDVILTKDVRTTCASKILDNFIAPYNATVITKLENAGYINMGKTNMDEFAMGSSNENSAYGVVKNPWDTSRVAGGSSGGSAAAVAARLIPFALGTDTGGSIRQPAALTGITGFKPTYGRNSRYGVIAFASSLDQVGVFATSVQDCALVSEIIAGFDENDSTSVNAPDANFTSVLGHDIQGIRIGIPKEYFSSNLNPDINRLIKATLKDLENLGAKLVEISLPHTEYAVATYYILAPAEASSNLSRYDGIKYGYRAKDAEDLFDLYCKTRSEGFGKEVKRRIMIGTYVLSSGYFDAYYLKAQKVRRLITDDFLQVFSKQCDLIVCPTTPTTAFKIGEKANNPMELYLSDIYTIPVNLAGLPGISIPCGFDKNGLPAGLQIIGKAWDEKTIFKVGYAYQQTTNWHKQIPRGY